MPVWSPGLLALLAAGLVTVGFLVSTSAHLPTWVQVTTALSVPVVLVAVQLGGAGPVVSGLALGLGAACAGLPVIMLGRRRRSARRPRQQGHGPVSGVPPTV